MDIFWTFYLNHLSPLWGYFLYFELKLDLWKKPFIVLEYSFDVCLQLHKESKYVYITGVKELITIKHITSFWEHLRLYQQQMASFV